jgi:hypothetical protein
MRRIPRISVFDRLPNFNRVPSQSLSTKTQGYLHLCLTRFVKHGAHAVGSPSRGIRTWRPSGRRTQIQYHISTGNHSQCSSTPRWKRLHPHVETQVRSSQGKHNSGQGVSNSFSRAIYVETTNVALAFSIYTTSGFDYRGCANSTSPIDGSSLPRRSANPCRI